MADCQGVSNTRNAACRKCANVNLRHAVCYPGPTQPLELERTPFSTVTWQGTVDFGSLPEVSPLPTTLLPLKGHRPYPSHCSTRTHGCSDQVMSAGTCRPESDVVECTSRPTSHPLATTLLPTVQTNALLQWPCSTRGAAAVTMFHAGTFHSPLPNLQGNAHMPVHTSSIVFPRFASKPCPIHPVTIPKCRNSAALDSTPPYPRPVQTTLVLQMPPSPPQQSARKASNVHLHDTRIG